MNRKVIYGIIYVGVVFTFPALPLGGLQFLGGFFGGVMVALKDIIGDYVKDLLWGAMGWN